jgi:chlorophyll synthase
MSRPQLSAVLELLKPITWFAPMWAFGCGVVSAGAFSTSITGTAEAFILVAVGVVLAGPMVCATSQAVNDWFDRFVDAINEPQRPIPSGRLPGRWGLKIAVGWTVLSLLVATTLGPFGFTAAVIGLALAWAYSAPPLRLKQSGWLGTTACALCYEGLPWATGAAVVAAAVPDPRVLALAGLYSFGAIGIMTLNDFKSVDGDRAMGIRSLPVQLGTGRAAKTACFLMIAPQLVVLGLLARWQAVPYAMVVGALVLLQLALMWRLLRDPRRYAAWYNATGTSAYVLGMLISALALRAELGA